MSLCRSKWPGGAHAAYGETRKSGPYGAWRPVKAREAPPAQDRRQDRTEARGPCWARQPDERPHARLRTQNAQPFMVDQAAVKAFRIEALRSADGQQDTKKDTNQGEAEGSVNGYPLSKLPLDYQRYSTFRQLFGEQILDVGPSSIPGMQFSACREQDGWLVHFAMKDNQLVVRAV